MATGSGRTGESADDGGHVAAVLLFWGALALLAWAVTGAAGAAGRSVLGFGESVALLFALTAVVNAAVYAGARRLRRTGDG